MTSFSRNGIMYHFVRVKSGVYKVLKEDKHIGDILAQNTRGYDKWSIETLGGQVLSSAETLEGAKQEVKNVLDDLEITSENE